MEKGEKKMKKQKRGVFEPYLRRRPRTPWLRGKKRKGKKREKSERKRIRYDCQNEEVCESKNGGGKEKGEHEKTTYAAYRKKYKWGGVVFLSATTGGTKIELYKVGSNSPISSSKNDCYFKQLTLLKEKKKGGG